MKPLFEKAGGTYHEKIGQLIPIRNDLPKKKRRSVYAGGVRYTDCHKKALYSSLTVSGKLNGRQTKDTAEKNKAEN